jgi:ABC-type multidrug transport system fused ATPase/permease subunit
MSLADRSLSSAFYRWAWYELWRDRHNRRSVRLLAIFIVATFLQSVANGLMATCAGLLGQTLVGQQFASTGVVVDSRTAQFPPLLLCFLGFLAAVVKTGAGALSVYGQKSAAFQAGNDLRQDLTDAIVRRGQPPSAATATHATLAIRLREVERGVDEGVLASFRAAAHIVPLVIALLLLSSTMALTALAALVTFALALAWIRRRLQASHARATRFAEELHTAVDELVRHLDLWRTYGAGGRVQRALATTGEEAAHASAHADAARTALSGANEALAAAALLGAVALVERGGFRPEQGSLVAFAAVFFLMYRPLRDLGDARTAVERGAQALDALDRVRAGLDSTSPSDSFLYTESCSLRTEKCPEWKLERFDVRSLSIARENWSTPTTSLYADPGEIIVLIGPTGSGKTTLLRALLGLERRMRGTIRYGDRDLTGAGVGPSERPFAWVPQESAIISGTLDDNIGLGAPPTNAGSSSSSSSSRAILEEFGAFALLARTEGVHLHAGGHELSGGERQWVAIARALASGLPVLLLDEPTSGLDPLSQGRVLEVLRSLRGKRTVILVTHRPEPLAIADRVVRLGEPNTHAEIEERFS